MQNNETLRIVWDGDSETDCVEICKELQTAGIEYKVSQRVVSKSTRMSVNWSFKVAVQNSDYRLAREALGLEIDGKQVEDQEFEIEESAAPIGVSQSNSPVKVDTYLKHWDPEKATVEVWSQDASNRSSIVSLSLTENLIHFRLERLDDGRRKFYVLPEDVDRAREILHEIEDGEPPR